MREMLWTYLYQPKQFEAALMAVFAALLGACIGYERELKRRSAGLCTHALLALAMCLFVETGFFLFEIFVQKYPENDSLRIEPAGIFQGLIIAMGFVAGGAILKNIELRKVENLTTACTVLCAGVVGACVGLRLLVLAVLCSCIVLCINILGGMFERYVTRTDK